MPTVNQLIRKPRRKVAVKSTAPDMMANPQKRGVCTRVYTTTPKKHGFLAVFIRKSAEFSLTIQNKAISYFIIRIKNLVMVIP